MQIRLKLFTIVFYYKRKIVEKKILTNAFKAVFEVSKSVLHSSISLIVFIGRDNPDSSCGSDSSLLFDYLESLWIFLTSSLFKSSKLKKYHVINIYPHI